MLLSRRIFRLQMQGILKMPCISFILLFLPFFTFAQVSFRAITDSKKVSKNGYVEVQFILENARGTNFRAPDFQSLRIISGPSQSMSTSIINGVQSSEMTYSYVLQPTRSGKVSIGRASIQAEGRTYRTDLITIEVVENRADDKNDEVEAGEEVFLRAELEQESVYIGQQIPLSYRIYTLKNINSYNILDESNYRGFYVEDLRRFNVNVLREEINGKNYTTKILKRVALFPQQTGDLKIDPMQMQVGIAKSEARNPRDFFFSQEVYRMNLSSEPITLNVEPLPPNAPTSFTGAVGDYSFSVNINQTRLTTDDALEIRVRITGNGDPKRVQAPDLELGDAFEFYAPQTVEGSPREMDDGIFTTKEYTYLAIPKEAGTHLLQPEFTYFDPTTATYETINSEPYTIRVEQGSNTPDSALPMPEVADTELRGIRTSTNLSQPTDLFFGSSVFWGLTALPILLFMGIIVRKRMKHQQANIDPLVLKNRRAAQVAKRHLAQAKAHLEAGKSRAFYDEVSKAMMGYINDKLNIPNSKLTKQVVAERLQTLQVPSEQINSFMQILNNCEMALYAGRDNTTAMKETYDRAVEALTKIEVR